MRKDRERVRGAHVLRKGPARVLIKRIAIMVFAFCLFATSLYVIGNRQLFLDETQRLLLGVIRWSSLVSASLSLIGFAFLAFSPPSVSGRRKGAGILAYALSSAASALIASLSFFVDALIR